MSGPTVMVRIELVETTRYVRTVPMTRAELGRYRALLGADDGDDDAKRDVADLMFSKFVDRMDDECQDLGLQVRLTEVEMAGVDIDAVHASRKG